MRPPPARHFTIPAGVASTGRAHGVYVVGKVRLSPLVDFDPAPALT
jgi:hypothetical protein